MNRRKFLSGSATAVGSLGLGSARLPVAADLEQVTGAKRPNILLLIADQHKRSCMGAAGDAVAVTPHLDALANESVRFTQAYCTNPVCAPSRASMLTGMYSHSLESRGNDKPFGFRHKTVAHDLGSAGYMTAMIGKMHFVDGQTHGFDYHLEFNDWFQQLGPKAKLYVDEVGHTDSGAGSPQIVSLWAGDPWKGERELDDRKGPVAVGRPSKMDEADHFESFVARESVRFLEEYAGENQPFFLISSFLKPHEPFMPATRFAAMFKAEKMKLSPTWHKADEALMPAHVREVMDEKHVTPELKDPGAAKLRMASYYGSLAQADDGIGQILGALERLGLEKDTIVVYTSDHGDMLGDLGLWGKTQFYEGSCGVPLLVRKPGITPGICEKPVSLVSLAATLAEFGRAAQTREMEGKSLAGQVAVPMSGDHEEPVFAEFALGTKSARYMIRKGRWKFAYWVNDVAELYDLQGDPDELKNLAADVTHTDRVAELRRELFAWHAPVET